MLKHVFVCYIFVVVQIIYLTCLETQNNYGEFVLKILKFDSCKGPKRNDCCNMSASIVNETILSVAIDIQKNVVLNRGKIVASMNNKTLVRLQMKNPCNHFFMKSIFITVYNVSQNCEFRKGYYLKNIDIGEIAQKYYGGMFLYGNLTFKTVFYSDECNFSCADVAVNFSPKENKKNISSET